MTPQQAPIKPRYPDDASVTYLKFNERCVMFGWFVVQAVVGTATIVFLIDAGLSKDEPYLVKLGFIGAFCATWFISKILDLFLYLQDRVDRSS